MLKIQERTNKDSCWNKAKDDEVLFIIKSSKDLAMAETIRFWIDKRIKLGLNKYEDDKIQEALICASLVEKIQNV